jgi:hypothetical protein
MNGRKFLNQNKKPVLQASVKGILVVNIGKPSAQWAFHHLAGGLKESNRESINTKKNIQMGTHHFKYTHCRLYIRACINNPTGSLCSEMGLFSCCSYFGIMDVERTYFKKDDQEKTRRS